MPSVFRMFTFEEVKVAPPSRKCSCRKYSSLVDRSTFKSFLVQDRTKGGSEPAPPVRHFSASVFPSVCFPQRRSTYTFVTHEDICRAFEGETLLAIVAPAETQLEVPVPDTVLWFGSSEPDVPPLLASPCRCLQLQHLQRRDAAAVSGGRGSEELPGEPAQPQSPHPGPAHRQGLGLQRPRGLPCPPLRRLLPDADSAQHPRRSAEVYPGDPRGLRRLPPLQPGLDLL